MGSFASSLAGLVNPSEQYSRFETQAANLHSNSLQDSIRRAQGEQEKERAKQEVVKTAEINHAWEAQQAVSDALKKFSKVVPAEGYTDGTDTSVAPTGVNPATGRPSLAMDNGATPGVGTGLPGNNLTAAVSGAPSSVPVPSGGAASLASALNPTATPSVAPVPTPAVPTASPLKKMNPNDPSTFKVDYDLEGMTKHLTGLGFGQEALKLSADRKAALALEVDRYSKAHKLALDKMTGLSNLLAAVPVTDFNETDPQKLQAQQQASQLGALQQLRLGVQNGLIDPAQENGLEQQIMSQPWNPQMQQQVTMMAKSATAAKDQEAHALNVQKELREKLTGESTIEKNKAETKEKGVEIAQKVLTAGAQAAAQVTDKPSWDAWYTGLSPEGKAAFATIYRRGFSPAALKTVGAMGQTAEQRSDAANAEEGRKLEKGRLGVEQGSLALRRKQFDATIGSGLDANGKPLSGDELKALASQDPVAVAISEYREKPTPAQLRGGQSSPIMRKVLALNPDYREQSFTERNKVQQDFSASGASGKLITSADTALAHLDAISQAGRALKSDDLQVLNRIANAVGAQTGNSAPVVYDAIVETVSPEISKAVIGGVGAAEDRKKMAESFSRKLSDAQREGTIGANANLLGQRIKKQAHAYEVSMEKPLDLEKRLSPESLSVMKRYGAGEKATGKKTATMDQVKAYAKAHSMSESDAKKAAEAEGFEVR